MRCNYILPYEGLLTSNGESHECRLKASHAGAHLVRLEDGQYILWEPDSECDCGEEDCQCFLWCEITNEEAREPLVNRTRAWFWGGSTATTP